MVVTRFFDTPMLDKVKLVMMTMATLVVILLSSAAFADSVVASLDKNVITENQVVQLTLRADFTNTGNGPDLNALKKNFDILGQSQNSQFSFNLGSNTAMSYWVISLMPKSTGTFEIPSIKIGNQASQPIQLVVKSAPQLLDSHGNAPVMVKTSVSETAPYLQQQVILTEQLYTSVSLQNADLSIPSNPDLVIERLTDDQMDYKTINGTQYQVLTRQYLVFPQKSGMITLDPQSVRAMASTQSGNRIVKVQSDPIHLQVQPIPASYTSDNWLPSSQVSISSKLTKTTDTPKVGDTLIWTIDVDAKDSLPEQIPQITFDSTPDYKLYPQPVKFSSKKTPNGITGHQHIKIEVVPTAAGKLTLPDVNVTYWDTKTQSTQTASATTPSMMVAALPSSTQSPQSDNTSAGKPISYDASKQTNETAKNKAITSANAPISLAKKEDNNPTASFGSDKQSVQETPLSRWYEIIALAATLIALMVATVIIYLRRKKDLPIDEEAHVPTLQDFAPLSSSDESSAFKSLLECCRQDNLPELRSHLLEWSRHRWGDDEIKGVDDIKRLAGSIKLTQLLMEAEIMMYSNQPNSQWEGASLADALEEYKSGQPKKSQASQLKTLYPNF